MHLNKNASQVINFKSNNYPNMHILPQMIKEYLIRHDFILQTAFDQRCI